MDKDSFEKTIVDNCTDWFEMMVLSAVLRDRQFRNQAFRVLCLDMKGKVAPDFTTDIDNAIYAALQSYFTCVGEKAPPISEAFAEVLFNQMAAQAKILAFSDVPNAMERLRFVLGQDIGSSLPTVTKGFSYWLKKQRTQRIIQARTGMQNWDPSVLMEELHQNTGAVTQLDQQDSFFEFGHGLDNQLLDIERIPITSLVDLTKALGGGFGKSEASLFIAPQSSGKTILATQVHADLSCYGQTGVLISTEQPHEQLEPRVISNKCRILFERIKDGVKPDFLSAEENQRIAEFRAKVKGKMFWEDWNKVDHSRSIAGDLRDVIHRRQDQLGKPLDYFILDWIGGALGKLSVGDMDKLRLIYQLTADTICQICAEENMYALAFAQAVMATSVNQMRIDASKLAECKSMGNNFTNVVGITLLYKDGVAPGDEDAAIYDPRQYFYVSKGRKSVGGKMPFLRAYEYQKMADLFRR